VAYRLPLAKVQYHFSGNPIYSFLGRVLPDQQLNNDAKDIVKLATGLIATLSALEIWSDALRSNSLTAQEVTFDLFHFRRLPASSSLQIRSVARYFLSGDVPSSYICGKRPCAERP